MFAMLAKRMTSVMDHGGSGPLYNLLSARLNEQQNNFVCSYVLYFKI